MPSYLINGEFIDASSQLEAAFEFTRRHSQNVNPQQPELISYPPDASVYNGQRFRTAEFAQWARGMRESAIVLTVPNSTRTEQNSVITGGGKTMIPIPLKFGAGWGVPTGTVSRATFAVSTVTTAQLAARVAALIQDLQSTGQAPTST